MIDTRPTECSVLEALSTRRSIRAFLPTPVSRTVIEDILRAASRAPSGANTQPWKVQVLSGAARAKLCERLIRAYNSDEPGHEDGYQYYPTEWFEPRCRSRCEIGGAHERTRRDRRHAVVDRPRYCASSEGHSLVGGSSVVE